MAKRYFADYMADRVFALDEQGVVNLHLSQLISKSY